MLSWWHQDFVSHVREGVLGRSPDGPYEHPVKPNQRVCAALYKGPANIGRQHRKMKMMKKDTIISYNIDINDFQRQMFTNACRLYLDQRRNALSAEETEELEAMINMLTELPDVERKHPV
jgi:hypothetical protein